MRTKETIIREYETSENPFTKDKMILETLLDIRTNLDRIAVTLNVLAKVEA